MLNSPQKETSQGKVETSSLYNKQFGKAINSIIMLPYLEQVLYTFIIEPLYYILLSLVYSPLLRNNIF